MFISAFETCYQIGFLHIKSVVSNLSSGHKHVSSWSLYQIGYMHSVETQHSRESTKNIQHSETMNHYTPLGSPSSSLFGGTNL